MLEIVGGFFLIFITLAALGFGVLWLIAKYKGMP